MFDHSGNHGTPIIELTVHMEFEDVAEPCIIETVVENILCDEGNAAETQEKKNEADEKEPSEAVAPESSEVATVSRPETVSDVQSSIAVLEISENTSKEPEQRTEGTVVDTVIDTADVSEPSTSTLDTAQSIAVEQITADQTSKSEDDAAKKELIENILAKLNDPNAKLNRRERRALQRELEEAQGIRKALPVHISEDVTTASADKTVVEISCISTLPRQFGGNKRSANAAFGEDKPIKVRKTEVILPKQVIVKESLFKFDNVAMVPHHSVTEDFHCIRMNFPSTSFPINNYLKLCRFSPKGTSVATTSADNSARIFTLDEDQRLSLAVKIPLGDPVYDATWLPDVSDSQLLATTAKHHPIHLWNEEGARISSYRGINHLDELTAAYSIAFSNDGSQLYAGYDACIRIWNCDRPGRQRTTIQTWDKHNGGQKSVVSCIAMNKFFAGVYAVATYDGTVGFYSDRTNSLECMFTTENSGITDMHYSSDGQRLFVAPRKCDELLCYDMRMPGTLMYKMLRPFSTNQKACFDLDSANRYLFSGTSDGHLVAFDLNDDYTEKLPIFSRKVADCSVPCVSIFDEKVPVVALGTGERVFPTPRITSAGTSSDSSDSEEDKSSYRRRRCASQLNNSLQLWTF
ncbi:unnamed protein product [Cylicocyclus nassatus]|uniref:WD repeat-containing protein 79 n=1 Tax=Cylicocyclus nassatus TaxID=53992 RepID=A0AA36MG25_CYLNA|nr:unnamed protein product [Cylicocyclus nassatus]